MRCRALDRNKERTPLTPFEYKKILELAVDCPLAGMPFDQVSYLYPLQIPSPVRMHDLNAESNVFSITLKQNFTSFIGVIGDLELKSAITNHPGAILFAVGNIVKKIKNERTYFNLKPRSWLIVVDEESFKREEIKKPGRKKKSIKNVK